MQKVKGIVLAGGTASRLFPITRAVSKQLLAVYNKPMIYYPLSVLMLAGIRDILIITTPQALPQFKELLNDGHEIGVTLNYAVQEKPRGLADAFIVGADFIGLDRVALVLGDNIFFGNGLSDALAKAVKREAGATVFGYFVKDPERYGVFDFDTNGKALSIEEKPANPRSNWAVTGLYLYDNRVVDIAKSLKPSARGELEITDIINTYLREGNLTVERLHRGYAWLDTGTYNSLLDASLFIKTIEERQGLMVGCVEEIAFRKGFISKQQLIILGKNIDTEYGAYLLAVADED